MTSTYHKEKNYSCCHYNNNHRQYNPRPAAYVSFNTQRLSATQLFTIVLIMSTYLPQTSSAWSTEWINLDSISKIQPPRSGHVAFGLNDKVYVFGGYAEESVEHRYPTNELWMYDPKDTNNDGWQMVHQSTNNDESSSTSSPEEFIPQQRLASTAVTCQVDGKSAGLVLGGWDSQEAGTGGVILQDLPLYVGDGDGDGVSPWKTLPFDLEQPTSRLCAVTLQNNPSKVLVHNHRCTDHVLIVDLESFQLIKQTTSGIAPSPRGLHACALLPNTNKMILFGGAAQDGNMSNEVFLLDTDTWQWEVLEPTSQEEEECPSPRASPCLVAIDETTCILFGGASRSEQGLHGCNDTWLLQVLESGKKCQWSKLNDDGSSDAPPGRNAATLTPLPTRPAALKTNEKVDGA